MDGYVYDNNISILEKKKKDEAPAPTPFKSPGMYTWPERVVCGSVINGWIDERVFEEG